MLQKRLEDVRKEFQGQQQRHADYAAEEADLKKLLQQFTRDSRDMLRCIEQLEQENAELRALIGEDVPLQADSPESAAAVQGKAHTSGAARHNDAA